MEQNVLHCIVWKKTKESEHLTQIPKPHISTSLIDLVFLTYRYLYCNHHF